MAATLTLPAPGRCCGPWRSQAFQLRLSRSPRIVVEAKANTGVRSKWKGPFVEENLLRQIAIWRKEKKEDVLYTQCRGSCIVPVMIGLTMGIHNGRDYIPIRITEQMVGHKLGEFAPTRKYTQHSRIVGGRKAKR